MIAYEKIAVTGIDATAAWISWTSIRHTAPAHATVRNFVRRLATSGEFRQPSPARPNKCAHNQLVVDILEGIVVGGDSFRPYRGQPATVEVRLKRDIRGFKSRPPARNAATVAVIELLLKGFAGARNRHYLQLWRIAV